MEGYKHEESPHSELSPIEQLKAEILEVEKTVHYANLDPETMSKLRELKNKLSQMKVDQGLV